MRFLLDVHMNATLARLLTAAGHDILRAALTHKRWSDERLLELAAAEGRIIVSQDSDFSELIYFHGKAAPPAVLYIRCEPEQQLEMNGRVLEVLETAGFDGHMVVIEPANTRYRPLPGKLNDNG